MKISKLLGERTKEAPSIATVKSQALLLRAGYIKQVSNGIYSLLTPAQKVSLKMSPKKHLYDKRTGADPLILLYIVFTTAQAW